MKDKLTEFLNWLDTNWSDDTTVNDVYEKAKQLSEQEDRFYSEEEVRIALYEAASVSTFNEEHCNHVVDEILKSLSQQTKEEQPEMVSKEDALQEISKWVEDNVIPMPNTAMVLINIYDFQIKVQSLIKP